MIASGHINKFIISFQISLSERTDRMIEAPPERGKGHDFEHVKTSKSSTTLKQRHIYMYVDARSPQ